MRHRCSSFLSPLFLACLGFGLAACDDQVAPEYRGEPLATLRGTVVTGAQAAPQGARAALAFQSPAAFVLHGPRFSATDVRVEGQYPASFTLDVLTPPPSEVLEAEPVFINEPRPTSAALAYIVALAPEVSPENATFDDIIGMSLDAFVVYFASDPEPGSYGAGLAQLYSVPARAGYHLATVYPLTLPERAQERATVRACRWAGLCVNENDDPSATPARFVQWDYQECLAEASPETVACTLTWFAPTPEQEAETRFCEEQLVARSERRKSLPGCGGGGIPPYAYAITRPNEAGFDTPVTITLGATVTDWLEQTY